MKFSVLVFFVAILFGIQVYAAPGNGESPTTPDRGKPEVAKKAAASEHKATELWREAVDNHGVKIGNLENDMKTKLSSEEVNNLIQGKIGPIEEHLGTKISEDQAKALISGTTFKADEKIEELKQNVGELNQKVADLDSIRGNVHAHQKGFEGIFEAAKTGSSASGQLEQPQHQQEALRASAAAAVPPVPVAKEGELKRSHMEVDTVLVDGKEVKRTVEHVDKEKTEGPRNSATGLHIHWSWMLLLVGLTKHLI